MLPTVRFKERPEDFVVDEIPAYPASGEGDHLFVTFRKVGLNSQDAVTRLAKALGAPIREAGIAGMKDKVAVTTQTASFPLPRGVDPAPLLAPFTGPELAVLDAKRHTNKLKPGHLDGNRFSIWLRGLSDESYSSIEDNLARVAKLGFPNYFGAQRFGRARDNAARALAFVRGDAPVPRDKKQLRFLFSALQSELFNRVLELREKDGTFARVLEGDLAKKRDTGGLFLVDARALAETEERARTLEVSATGPMFGASMRSPEGVPLAIEQGVLASSGISEADLHRFRQAGEGTRRPLRLVATDLGWSRSGADLHVSFVLPKGGYATTLLESVCVLAEPVRGAPGGGETEENPSASDA
ncbi:MAG: tRNA pseudouridine(13) synthase TruD [Myxococcales bacterium]|nr:tRNA pseudouridine(13) synthase TruD [Myxococcales bacterium]